VYIPSGFILQTPFSILWILRKRLSYQRQVEKLDKVYTCKKCGAAFLFRADTQDHGADTSHFEFMITVLE
jgi:hypothetical protein